MLSCLFQLISKCFRSTQKNKRYDIFLSYAHADAKLFGQNFIAQIKREIEQDLYDITCRSLVFLDTDALNYGDEWHAKIMEKLSECRIFICLLSENYLKSEYCARERLWWAQKELKDGRIRQNTLPIYYVEICPDLLNSKQPNEISELFGLQTNPLPWFSEKEKVKEVFIKERLSEVKVYLRKKLQKRTQISHSLCTVVPGLSSSFVGRLSELKKLREFCANGRYPVIQAAGGVGKTELAVAYVYGYAEEYPGGRFMIRMEHVSSWQDAVCSLITDTNSGLISPKDIIKFLGLPSDIQTRTREDQHREIISALWKMAQRNTILLFLDNVSDPDIFTEKKMRQFSLDTPIPANLHMIATTRQSMVFPKNARAEAFPIGNLEKHAAFELFCQIGNNEFPFCKRPPRMIPSFRPSCKSLNCWGLMRGLWKSLLAIWPKTTQTV